MTKPFKEFFVPKQEKNISQAVKIYAANTFFKKKKIMQEIKLKEVINSPGRVLNQGSTGRGLSLLDEGLEFWKVVSCG